MRLKMHTRYHLWSQFSLAYFVLQILVRLVLLIEQPPHLWQALKVLGAGFLWDAGTWLVLSVPFMLLSVLLPERWHVGLQRSRALPLFLFTVILLLSFIGFSELTFWWEFHSRFNFIAVDYLVYTNEVLHQIMESFPLGQILLGLVVFAALLTWLLGRIQWEEYTGRPFLQRKVIVTLFGFVLPSLFAMGVGPWLDGHEANFHADQLARNGYFEFARAFRANKIDYQAFYPVTKLATAEQLVKQHRAVTPPAPVFGLAGRRPNVVMIVVESLGAKFIGPLGHAPKTTPYLNALAEQSIFFENFYATGTRTVRGLEALTLSLPPTPGYAVVKRPHNQGLYSLGHTLQANAYRPIFLYGGRGFFDNMNDFFSGNGFETIDQEDFSGQETTFSNAWGVCDEDLFRKAEQIISKQDPKQPFFLFALTTSNHRPFTYPDGKIDIPSGTSRAGAVKYTDYAIGTFLERAIKQPWAQNTIFVVVADHSTEGRGQFDLEMEDFHIPLWIYSPALLKPQRVKKLGSQIDLVPTLVHLLDLKDNSPFFGRSFFDERWQEERAFVGNYQFVGFYKDRVLTTLGPNRVIRQYSFDPVSKQQSDLPQSGQSSPEEAMSYYQFASFLLDQDQYHFPVSQQ